MPYSFNPFTGNLDDTGNKVELTSSHVAYGDSDNSVTGSSRLTYDEDTSTFYVKDIFANYDPDSFDIGYSNIHDNRGYNDEYITDQILYNCRIQGSSVEESGSIRVINETAYIYLNGQWNEIVNNFRFREDDDEDYELEHKPIGFNWWYEVASGNSNEIGFNGLPLVQQYRTTMGAYPVPMEFDGGTF